MSKNICLIDATPLPAESLLKKVTRLITGTADKAPASSETRRGPGPVLHRLPDLRKFGPNIV